MATPSTNPKYQPALQHDPDNDFTHAPPAYAEGSSRPSEEQGLFGPPRSSEDNLPDDFKVRRPMILPATCKSDHTEAGPLCARHLPIPRTISMSITNISEKLTEITVWRLRGRSNRRHSQPIRPQSLHHPHTATSRHCGRQLPHLLQRLVSKLDPSSSTPRLDFRTLPPPSTPPPSLFSRISPVSRRETKAKHANVQEEYNSQDASTNLDMK